MFRGKSVSGIRTDRRFLCGMSGDVLFDFPATFRHITAQLRHTTWHLVTHLRLWSFLGTPRLTLAFVEYVIGEGGADRRVSTESQTKHLPEGTF